MATYAFLSPEWIDAARALHDEHARSTAPAGDPIRMNLVVEEVPFGATRLDAHLDTSDGSAEIDLGHLESADVKVTLDYATAKSILVDGNGEVAMQAFMAGRIRVEGDLAKLLAFQTAPPGPGALAAAEAIRAITD